MMPAKKRKPTEEEYRRKLRTDAQRRTFNEMVQKGVTPEQAHRVCLWL